MTEEQWILHPQETTRARSSRIEFKSAPVEGGTGNGKSDGDELFRGK